ncbi:organomercurial lyase [Planctomycetota bacterium]
MYKPTLRSRCFLCVLAFLTAGLTQAKELPKLLDLGATECIPCKKMAPILEELDKEMTGRLEVEFIDVWKNPNEAPKYKVTTIPTQIFLDPQGKELWRHVGFISREDILGKWKELGYDLSSPSAAQAIERWEPLKPNTRPQNKVCQLCDGDIQPKTQVIVNTEKGPVRLCSPHCFFIMESCMTEDKTGLEDHVTVTDWNTGKSIPLTKATYLMDMQTHGRPVIKAFATHAAAEKNQGNLLSYAVLKQKELAVRCGFCDRAVYPEDAALVKVSPGLHSYGCCAHCALGVAARMGTDIEVHQPDGLTGEPIIIKTLNGSIASIQPEDAIAWFGMRKKADGTWGSAGCFHQGNFINQDNLQQWLKNHPYETGKQITISKALADKMKLSQQQIQKACKIGECAPK